MNPDDPVCLCFHVSRRKVLNFIRLEKPKRPSQMSQCFGAGTGCGWCRPWLERLLAEYGDSGPDKPKDQHRSQRELAQSDDDQPNAAELSITADEYARQRASYVRRTGAQLPSGATPVIPGAEPPEEMTDH